LQRASVSCSLRPDLGQERRQQSAGFGRAQMVDIVARLDDFALAHAHDEDAGVGKGRPGFQILDRIVEFSDDDFGIERFMDLDIRRTRREGLTRRPLEKCSASCARLEKPWPRSGSKGCETSVFSA
jgi:hypothetical protein